MRICFVCLGNICRSPTAEGVMRALVAAEGLASRVEVDSAGTDAWHVGEPPDPRTCAAAEKRGYDLYALRARQFQRSDLERFDLVLAMDRTNLLVLQRLAGTRTDPRIRLLRSFDATAAAGAEVPDPYSGGAADFDSVVDMCERACRGLLDYVQTQLP